MPGGIFTPTPVADNVAKKPLPGEGLTKILIRAIYLLLAYHNDEDDVLGVCVPKLRFVFDSTSIRLVRESGQLAKVGIMAVC